MGAEDFGCYLDGRDMWSAKGMLEVMKEKVGQHLSGTGGQHSKRDKYIEMGLTPPPWRQRIRGSSKVCSSGMVGVLPREMGIRCGERAAARAMVGEAGGVREARGEHKRRARKRSRVEQTNGITRYEIQALLRLNLG